MAYRNECVEAFTVFCLLDVFVRLGSYVDALPPLRIPISQNPISNSVARINIEMSSSMRDTETSLMFFSMSSTQYVSSWTETRDIGNLTCLILI